MSRVDSSSVLCICLHQVISAPKYATKILTEYRIDPALDMVPFNFLLQ